MTLDPAGLEAAAKLARSCTPTAREDARLAEQIVRAYLAAAPDTGRSVLMHVPVTPTTGPLPQHCATSYAAGFAAGRAAATPDPPTSDEFTEAAWGLIANAYGGNWSEAPDEWHGAAARWRDEYVAGAVAAPPAASPDERLRSALAAADRPQPPADERLREAAQVAVFACLPVLHIVGSQNRGYRVSDVIDPKVIADPQEWVDAAHAICELHHVLAAADREKPDADMQAAMDRADEELRAELDAPLVSDDPVPDPETNT